MNILLYTPSIFFSFRPFILGTHIKKYNKKTQHVVPTYYDECRLIKDNVDVRDKSNVYCAKKRNRIRKNTLKWKIGQMRENISNLTELYPRQHLV